MFAVFVCEGLQIVYDLKKPSGKRLVSAQALCQRCDIPKYQPVKVDEKYSIVLPTFTAGGGDGFDFELKDGDQISPGRSFTQFHLLHIFLHSVDYNLISN